MRFVIVVQAYAQQTQRGQVQALALIHSHTAENIVQNLRPKRPLRSEQRTHAKCQHHAVRRFALAVQGKLHLPPRRGSRFFAALQGLHAQAVPPSQHIAENHW